MAMMREWEIEQYDQAAYVRASIENIVRAFSKKAEMVYDFRTINPYRSREPKPVVVNHGREEMRAQVTAEIKPVAWEPF